jgi:hypothetical protein
MISRRLAEFTKFTEAGSWRFDLESDTHILTGRGLHPRFANLPNEPAGSAFIHRNTSALARARLAGSPVYASDQQQAGRALMRLGPQLRDHLVVEDSSHPLPADATVSGTAQIVEDLPERVTVEVDAATPAYLVLADTFDPGWSATIDGQPVPIRPAYIAFRAVFVPQGRHTVIFAYRPAGFELGLGFTGCGIALGLLLWFWPWQAISLAPEHATLDWPRRWRTGFFLALAGIILVSAFEIGAGGRFVLHSRWNNSLHTFTWGSGLHAMQINRH